MSIYLEDIPAEIPVTTDHIRNLLRPFGLSIDVNELADYQQLLASVHLSATKILDLPDYQPYGDKEKYPRHHVRVPGAEEQNFGHAWAYKFLINGDKKEKESGSSLSGKTACIKDCIAVAGVPQSFGSDAFPAWTPNVDATVITRLLNSGVDIVGTSTCESFCNSASSFTSAQGIVHNPHYIGYSAGGSTSGGVALVGGGIVDFAIGTDQGGSVRIPSSLSGCVGLKPSHGLIPYTGIISGNPIDDHAGPLARSVLDVALLLDALAGYDGIDDRSLAAGPHRSFSFAKTLMKSTGRLDGIKIGILGEGFGSPKMQDDVSRAVMRASKELESLGALIEDISVPLHEYGTLIWMMQSRMSGSAGILGQAFGRRGLGLTEFEKRRLPWTDQMFKRLFPSTKNVIINGLYLQQTFPGLYSKTLNLGRQIRDEFESRFTTLDAIIMPTTPFVAPRHGDRDSIIPSFLPSIGMISNTAIFNVTGHPALTVPIGRAPAAEDKSILLPVGMQIVAGLGQDGNALKIGYAWESASGKDTLER